MVLCRGCDDQDLALESVGRALQAHRRQITSAETALEKSDGIRHAQEMRKDLTLLMDRALDVDEQPNNGSVPQHLTLRCSLLPRNCVR